MDRWRRRSATANSVFGLNNPTLASSETAGHAASFGNDGNAATFWQAQNR
jgi:hypothetical protein